MINSYASKRKLKNWVKMTEHEYEEIKDIEIYSESGMLVSSMSGNGEQVMTVNVSNLASGYYFMRVNNLAPVKIIKN